LKDFDKIILVSLKMLFYYQLSYSVSKVQSEVAVRVCEAGALESKPACGRQARSARKSVPKETPYES
jgi:hypothetical protein